MCNRLYASSIQVVQRSFRCWWDAAGCWRHVAITTSTTAAHRTASFTFRCFVVFSSFSPLPSSLPLVHACSVLEQWVENGTQGLNYARIEPCHDEDEPALHAVANAASAMLRAQREHAGTPVHAGGAAALLNGASLVLDPRSVLDVAVAVAAVAADAEGTAAASASPSAHVGAYAAAVAAAAAAGGASPAAPAAVAHTTVSTVRSGASAALDGSVLTLSAGQLRRAATALRAYTLLHLASSALMARTPVASIPQVLREYGPMPVFDPSAAATSLVRLTHWLASVLPLDFESKNHLLYSTIAVSTPTNSLSRLPLCRCYRTHSLCISGRVGRLVTRSDAT